MIDNLWLKASRKTLGWTQTETARRAGVPQCMVSDFENNAPWPLGGYPESAILLKIVSTLHAALSDTADRKEPVVIHGILPDPRPEWHPSIKYVRAGTGRDEFQREHTYAQTDEGLWPMCGYGWNRSNGYSYSIFRSAPGTESDCKLCFKNLASGKPPLADGWPHKTKYI